MLKRNVKPSEDEPDLKAIETHRRRTGLKYFLRCKTGIHGALVVRDTWIFHICDRATGEPVFTRWTYEPVLCQLLGRLIGEDDDWVKKEKEKTWRLFWKKLHEERRSGPAVPPRPRGGPVPARSEG